MSINVYTHTTNSIFSFYCLYSLNFSVRVNRVARKNINKVMQMLFSDLYRLKKCLWCNAEGGNGIQNYTHRMSASRLKKFWVEKDYKEIHWNIHNGDL